MLQENYSIIIPLVLAITAVLVKLVSRPNGDTSPKRNDTCIGQSVMLGALATSLIFAANAYSSLQDLNSVISSRQISVSESETRIKAGRPTVEDEALVLELHKQLGLVYQRTKAVVVCLVIASFSIMFILAFAVIDRYEGFEEVNRSELCECKGFERKWAWWAVLNVLGIMAFVTVLLLTKPGN